MQKMIGFILFWIGIGMTIMFFITNVFVSVCIIAIFIISGYKLFCK